LKRVRVGVCTIVAFLCAVVLGGSADSARTQGGAAWMLTPVAAGQKFLRVDVEGDTLYGFQLRGTDFTVTGVKSVRASGGPTPQCSVSGTPTTLACNGELPGGISVFVQLTTSGSGGAYEFGFLFSPGDTNPLYIPSSQTAPPLTLGGSLGMTSPTQGRVTIRNLSQTTLQKVEVSPIDFSVSSVATPDCGLSTEGGSIACNRPLPPGQTAAISFGTTSVSGEASAYLVGYTGGTVAGFAFVEAGAPCPDLQANVAGMQAELKTLQGEIAKLNRGLHSLGRAVPAKPVKPMKQAVARLQRRLAVIRKELRVSQKQLHACAQGERKAAAAAACDTQWKAAAQAAGRAAALKESLAGERRVARSARALIVSLKRLGPRPGARKAIATLTALSVLPGKTAHAYSAAKGAAKRANTAVTRCNAALDQG
jgi:hypothetical protein